MENKEKNVEHVQQKLMIIKNIFETIADCHALNQWENGDLRGALALLICADFVQQGKGYKEIDDFISSTWSFYQKMNRENDDE
jgi:hypothetical protein